VRRHAQASTRSRRAAPPRSRCHTASKAQVEPGARLTRTNTYCRVSPVISPLWTRLRRMSIRANWRVENGNASPLSAFFRIRSAHRGRRRRYRRGIQAPSCWPRLWTSCHKHRAADSTRRPTYVVFNMSYARRT
jgi:hypothetical protein